MQKGIFSGGTEVMFCIQLSNQFYQLDTSTALTGEGPAVSEKVFMYL